MPLPLPVLDDRTYQDLLDEAIERIPVDAPQWTDYNASDPGITLLELFAYLSEASIYRLDRVPQRQYRAFLRLIGCNPRSAQTALSPIRFAIKPAATAIDLPANVQIADPNLQTVFQTATPFHVTDAKLQAVVTVAGGRILDRTESNATLAAPFRPLGDKPQADDALYLGFDRALGDTGTRIRLFVFGEDSGNDLQTWRALCREWRRNINARTNSGECPPCSTSQPWQHYGVRVAWEFYDGYGWQALASLKDFTRALSLSGPVRWRSPAAGVHQSGGLAGYESAYFIRCRLLQGAYDCPPVIRGVWVNTVVARHAADIGDAIQLDGRGTGRAWQRFRLPRAPVVAGSTRLALKNQQGPLNEAWRERADFDRSGGHARDYVLDATTGDINFGDGREGRVLGAGVTLAATWKVGGGANGNVPARTLTALPAEGINQHIGNWNTIRPTLEVFQPIAAFGGADAESSDAIKARGFRMVSEDRCAATLADLERIACATPGVPVALAYAVAEHHPRLGCLPAAGCVALVIVPRCVNINRDPTPAMCAAVAAYIEPRRPIALEIHVTGPQYTVVAVDASLALVRNADRSSVIAQARLSLKKFLDPLSGGPGDTGWPVGRTVYRSEILALLDAIPGVSYVADLTLTADQDTPAHCGDIPICANGLAISGDHRITAMEGTRT